MSRYMYSQALTQDWKVPEVPKLVRTMIESFPHASTYLILVSNLVA